MRRVVSFKTSVTPQIEFMVGDDLVSALDALIPLDHQRSWATILDAIMESLPEKDQPILLLSGACHPKDVEKFFVVNDEDKSLKGTLSLSKALIKEFHGDKPMMVIFYLELMGTAASKYLLKFMNQLLNLKEMGADITFYWFYNEGDSDMRKAGEDVRNILGTTNFPVLKKIPIAEKQENISIN